MLMVENDGGIRRQPALNGVARYQACLASFRYGHDERAISMHPIGEHHHPVRRIAPPMDDVGIHSAQVATKSIYERWVENRRLMAERQPAFDRSHLNAPESTAVQAAHPALVSVRSERLRQQLDLLDRAGRKFARQCMKDTNHPWSPKHESWDRLPACLSVDALEAYPTEFGNLISVRALSGRIDFVLFQCSHEREVSVLVTIVESIADNEFVRNVKRHEVWHVLHFLSTFL